MRTRLLTLLLLHASIKDIHMANVDFVGTAKFAKVFESNRDMGENLQDGDQKNKIV